MDQPTRYTITLDDDATVAKIIAKFTGISSLPFAAPSKLLERAHSYRPVAAFIDVHLGPEDCGLDAIPGLRSAWPYIPILIITADPEDSLIGPALATGANDFIQKPIRAGELRGRLSARIAEMKARETADILHIGDLAFCLPRLSLERAGVTRYIPKLEAKLLQCLCENMRMLVSKDLVHRRIWGNVSTSANALDKKISSLRSTLNELNSNVSIETHYGKGLLLKVKKNEARRTSQQGRKRERT